MPSQLLDENGFFLDAARETRFGVRGALRALRSIDTPPEVKARAAGLLSSLAQPESKQ